MCKSIKIMQLTYKYVFHNNVHTRKAMSYKVGTSAREACLPALPSPPVPRVVVGSSSMTLAQEVIVYC